MNSRNSGHDLSIRPNIYLYSQLGHRHQLQSLGQNPAVSRHRGRSLGAKDVIAVVRVEESGDLIIHHVRERTNISEVKNHDPRELIGEVSSDEKGVKRRRSDLVMFRRIKAVTQLDKEIAQTAAGIAKLDRADLGASGRLFSDNVKGCSSAGFKSKDVFFFVAYLALKAVKTFLL